MSFLLEAFAACFFENVMRILRILGPRGSSKVWLFHERYCKFAKIALFIPRGAPRVIVDDFLMYVSDSWSILRSK